MYKFDNNSCRPASGVLPNIDHQKIQISTKYGPNIDHTALYRPNIDRKSSLKSAYLQNYTFRDKSTHVHNGSTLIYPISQEMHVKEDAGEYFHISSFHTLLSPVIYHITILGDFFYKISTILM